MSYETISIATDDRGVATLTLDRADKHNALSATMIRELTEAAHALGSDAGVRVVVLTGAGKSFCAGGDLGWMQDQMAADPETRFVEARKLAMMLKALNEMPKPLIGRVQGQAFGGGIGMCSVCDVAIAAVHDKFGLTETRRVFMNARIFGAAEAERLGVVAGAVPEDALNEAVEAEVRPYLACAPGAVAAAKALARRLGPPSTEAIIDDTIRALVDCWEGAEAQEGIGAFFEKRKARWMET